VSRRSAVDPEVLRRSIASWSGAQVTTRETHISWVFLTPERAFKLKKPLALPYLDYRLPSRRRQMCREEVRLNHRLAPDIYLGVRSVLPTEDGVALGDDDDPGAIDYVVEMRPYDEECTLAAKLLCGELQEHDVRAVGQRVAVFHANCAARYATQPAAFSVEQEFGRNVQELLEVVDEWDDRLRVRTLARFTSVAAMSRSRQLQSRAQLGLVRDGHGDLRAEHVVLDGEVNIVDCVEFDPAFRTLDVADDLAFLAMDLTALGGAGFIRPLLEAYRLAGGDCGDDGLVALFAVHRALIRMKVLLERGRQRPSDQASEDRAQARRLLAVAERLAWQARLPLTIVVCGVPASGKSHVAAALSAASGLPTVSSDVVRKRLAGLEPQTRAAPEHYSADFNHRTYSELGRRAAAALKSHSGVVVDATFRHRGDRGAFEAGFASGSPRTFVQCLAPADVLRQRATARDQEPSRISDATLHVVERERIVWQPLDEIPATDHILVRTDRPLAAILSEVAVLLDERLVQACGSDDVRSCQGSSACISH